MHGVHIGGLDLNLLRVLHVLLSERSVTRGAKALGLSPSATSHALARLRTMLDDPLLVRAPAGGGGGGGAGFTLTARAESMVAPLKTAFAHIEDALVPAPVFDAKAASRRFYIAASDYAELLLLPPLASQFSRIAPQIELWLRPITNDAIASLRRGDVDLVIGVFPHSELDADIRATFLLDDRFVCMVRKTHALASTRSRRRKKVALTLPQFAKARHLLVAPRGMGGGPVDDALRRHGFGQRAVTIAVPHFTAAAHLVAQTDLVLTITQRIARLFAQTLPVQILEPPIDLPPIRVAMLWHNRHDSDPGHRWLRTRLIDAGKELAFLSSRD